MQQGYADAVGIKQLNVEDIAHEAPRSVDNGAYSMLETYVGPAGERGQDEGQGGEGRGGAACWGSCTCDRSARLHLEAVRACGV